MGHQSSLSNSPGSTRIQFEAARTAAGVGGGLLWLGSGRGVRVVGSGDLVAISAVSWFSWRSCGPERSAGWL